MLKDTKSLGNNKAPACESRGFVRKIMKVCILTHLLSCFGAIIPNRNAMHPFICPFHLSIFRFYSLFLFSLLSYCYLYGTKLVKNDIFYENGLLLFHSSCLISNGFS